MSTEFNIPAQLQSQVTGFLSAAKATGSPSEGLINQFRTSKNPQFREQSLNLLLALAQDPGNASRFTPPLLSEMFSFFTSGSSHPQLLLVSSAAFLTLAENAASKSKMIPIIGISGWLSQIFKGTPSADLRKTQENVLRGFAMLGKDEGLRSQLTPILPFLQSYLSTPQGIEGERGRMLCLWACAELVPDSSIATKFTSQHNGVHLLFSALQDPSDTPAQSSALASTSSPSVSSPKTPGRLASSSSPAVGSPTAASAAAAITNNCREYALVAIGKLTLNPATKAAVASEKTGLGHVLKLLSLKLSEGITQRSLQILANVCTDPNGKKSVQQSASSFQYISSLLPVNPSGPGIDQNSIFFTLRLLNNLMVSDEDIEKFREVENGFDRVFSVLSHEAFPTNIRAEALILLSNILSDDFYHGKFVRIHGIQLILKLLQSNVLEYKRDSAKAIANMSIYFDEIRQHIFANGGAPPLVAMLAFNNEDLQYQALRALTNLALSYKYASELVRLGVLKELMRFINSESRLKPIALKLFVNLTNNDKARPHVTKAIGNLSVCTNLLSHKDPVVQLSAVKLITNLTTQGQNRKWLNENKAQLQELEKLKFSQIKELKEQVEVALANVSFPYEDRYIDESMMQLPQLVPISEDDADEQEKKRLKELHEKEEEERKLQESLQETKRKLLKAKIRGEDLRNQMIGWEEQEFKRQTMEAKKKAIDMALNRLHSAQKNTKKAEQNLKEKKIEFEQSSIWMSPTELSEFEKKVTHSQQKFKTAQEFQQWCEEELKRLEVWIKNENTTDDKRKEAERIQRLKSEEEKQKKLEQEAWKKLQEGERKLQLLGQQRLKQQEEIEKKRTATQLPTPPHRPAAPQRSATTSAVRSTGSAQPMTEEEKKLLSKRTNITREIYDTEKSYLDSMNILLWKFQKPLETLLSTGKGVITKEQIKTLFSNVEIIVNFNTLILDGLSNRLGKWDPAKTKIGDIFIGINAFLKCYVEYVNNYNAALNMLGSLLKESEKFENFVHKVEKTPETRGLDLQSFLIMPVQRIPRYVMLLADLYKNTLTTHPDYVDLGTALEKMKETGDHINEQKRESENIQKLLEIERCLHGLTILEPWRRYVSEESVILFKKEFKEVRSAYIHVFNDLVILSYPKKKSKRHMKYLVKASFAATQVKPVRQPDVKGHTFLFTLGGVGLKKPKAGSCETLQALPDRQSSDPTKRGDHIVFDLQASSEPEVNRIIAALTDSSRESVRRENTFSSLKKNQKIVF